MNLVEEHSKNFNCSNIWLVSKLVLRGFCILKAKRLFFSLRDLRNINMFSNSLNICSTVQWRSVVASQVQGIWLVLSLGYCLCRASVNVLHMSSALSSFLPPPKNMAVYGLAKINCTYSWGHMLTLQNCGIGDFLKTKICRHLYRLGNNWTNGQ